MSGESALGPLLFVHILRPFFPFLDESIAVSSPIAAGTSSGVYWRGRLEVRLVPRLVLNLKACVFMFLELWEQRENGHLYIMQSLGKST